MVMAYLGREDRSTSQPAGACRGSNGSGFADPFTRVGTAEDRHSALDGRSTALTRAAGSLSFEIVMSMEAAVRPGARARRSPSAQRAESRDQA